MKTPAQYCLYSSPVNPHLNISLKGWRIWGFVAMLIVVVMASLLHADDTPMAQTQAPGYYRMMLGEFEVTAYSDGTSPSPIDQIMSDPTKVRAEFDKIHLLMPYQMSFNIFLINTGKKLVMIDTGRGQLAGPKGGALTENLHKSGYEPGQIDIILITHMHGDHVGGLSADGQRVFPNATVYASKQEADFWLHTKPDHFANPKWKGNAQSAHATVDPYIQADRFKTLDGPTQLLPGIQSIPSFGHTPGHTAYLMQSQDRSMLFIGDTIHCAEVQFPYPSLTIQYDVNPDHARDARMKLLQTAANKGYIIAAPHISFPGLGHLSPSGNGFRWVPVQYKYLVGEKSE